MGVDVPFLFSFLGVYRLFVFLFAVQLTHCVFDIHPARVTQQQQYDAFRMQLTQSALHATCTLCPHLILITLLQTHLNVNVMFSSSAVKSTSTNIVYQHLCCTWSSAAMASGQIFKECSVKNLGHTRSFVSVRKAQWKGKTTTWSISSATEWERELLYEDKKHHRPIQLPQTLEHSNLVLVQWFFYFMSSLASHCFYSTKAEKSPVLRWDEDIPLLLQRSELNSSLCSWLWIK